MDLKRLKKKIKWKKILGKKANSKLGGEHCLGWKGRLGLDWKLKESFLCLAETK